MRILSGSSNQPLAQEVADLLGTKLVDVELTKFPNGEKRVWVKEDLKGEEVAIVQSFSEPVDEHIIEFCLLADSCKHMDTNKIIGVVPWLGYSPQDKSFRTGEPISVHVIARIMEIIGMNKLITVDIHSLNSLKFFEMPTVHLSSLDIFVDHFKDQDLSNHIVISVDKGSIERCTEFSQKLNLPLCVFDKVRDRDTGAVSLELKSGDVADKIGIAFDDFVSTGATRISASQILKGMGLIKYIDCITHALLAGDSSQKLADSQIDEIITTNTYFVPDSKKFPKLKVLSIAKVLAGALSQD